MDKIKNRHFFISTFNYFNACLNINVELFLSKNIGAHLLSNNRFRYLTNWYFIDTLASFFLGVSLGSLQNFLLCYWIPCCICPLIAHFNFFELHYHFFSYFFHQSPLNNTKMPQDETATDLKFKNETFLYWTLNQISDFLKCVIRYHTKALNTPICILFYCFILSNFQRYHQDLWQWLGLYIKNIYAYILYIHIHKYINICILSRIVYYSKIRLIRHRIIRHFA